MIFARRTRPPALINGPTRERSAAFFTEVGDATVATLGGTSFVRFDANEGYRGPTAPAGVTGSGDRTIELWVSNATIAAEDTMVAWGHRGGPDGTNMAFGFGSNATFGAAGHWGAADMGWNGTPSAATLHHLVYTYDGTTARVYADGVEKNSRVVALNTHALATDTINLMAQQDAAGSLAFLGDGMDIALMRVHDGALTAGQVLSNFSEGIPEPSSATLLAAAVAGAALRRRRPVRPRCDPT